jgi:UDP-N-acetylmuramoyl-tripeptide--D-alanyl-D-alanine ligase
MDNCIDSIYKLYLENKRVFTDSRSADKGGIFFALKGDNFNGNDYAKKALASGAKYAIVDQEQAVVNESCILVDNALETLQKLANYHRKTINVPVLAITGSNGKTTTKELITAVLSRKYDVLATKGNLNNHIGVPLTLLEVKNSHEMVVVEMGANHIGEIDFLCNIAEPDYGIITNVGKAHLEGFGSFEGVKKAKGELYNYISAHGEAIFINTDNEHLNKMASMNKIQHTYAVENPKAQLKGNVAGDDILLTAKVLFPKGWLYIKSNLTGVYNLENILAAARIGLFFDVDPLQIQKGIEAYVPDNKRSQIVKKSGAVFLVDCYNANPTSMEASIKNFSKIDKNNKVYVLGDMLELGSESGAEHQKVIECLEAAGASEVFTVGRNFMSTINSYINFETVDDLLESIDRGYWRNKFVMLKASRGIKLEKILDAIK